MKITSIQFMMGGINVLTFIEFVINGRIQFYSIIKHKKLK